MTRTPRRLKEQLQDSVGEQVRDLPLHAVRLAMFGVGRALLLSDRMTRDYKEITEGGGVRPVLGRLRDDVQGTAEKVVGRVVERVRGEEAEPEPEDAEPVRAARVAEPPARPAARGAAEEIAVGKPGGGTRHTPKHARPGAPPKPAKPGALGRHHAQRTDRPANGTAAPVARPAPKPAPSEPKPEPAAQAEPAPSPEPAKPARPAKPAKPAKPESKSAKPAAAAKRGAKDEAAYEPKPETKPAAPAEAEHIVEDLPVPDYDSATLPQLRARLRGLTVDQVKLLREYERKHAAREDVIGMYERRIAKLDGLS